MHEDYKRLIEEIRDVYFVIQQERLVLVSNYTAELYGYSRDELIGKHFMGLVAPEERERLSRYYKMRTEGQQVPERYESIFLTKDGTRIPGEVSVWLTRFRDQPAVAGIVINITERKLIMQKLQDSEEKYRNIVENSPDIIYTADPEGVVHSVNSNVTNILGYAPEEVIGRKFMDFIPPQAMPQVMEDHNQLCSGDNITSSTLTFSKDGVERHLEFRSVPFIRDGTVVMAQGIIRDITDRMRAEEKLCRMFESMTDGVVVTDLEGFITELNLKTAEIHRFGSRDELLGKNAFELVAPCDRQRAIDNIQKTMDLGLIRNIEYRLLREDGSEFYGELSASVIKDAFGKPEGYVSITRDITKRKQAEEKYVQLLEDMNDGYGVIQDGNYVFINKRLGEIFGYKPEQILGGSIEQFMLPEDRPVKMHEYEKVMLGEEAPFERYEGEVLRGDGATIEVEFSIKAIQYQGKPAFSIISRDVTERKRTEELLRESRERFQALTESTSDWIWEVDTNGVYTYASPKVKDLLGYAPEEVVGKTPFDLMHPEEAKRVINEFRDSVDSQRPFERLENNNLHKDGRLVVLETSGVPFFNATGRLLGYRGIDREITERKRADEQLSEAYEMLRLVFECAPYGIMFTDSNMNIVQANKKMVNLFGGISKDIILGKSWLDFLPQHLQKKAKQYLSRFQSNESVMDVEYPIVKPNGSKIIAATSFGVLRDSTGNLLGLIAIIRDITLEKQIKENKEFYIAETIKASESERKRLARALHDDTIQEIMFATYRLKDVITGNHGSLPESVHSNLQDIQLLLKKIAVEVRKFTTNLRPDILDDMGLVPALEWLTDRLRDESGMEARLNILGNERRLSTETELTLFRIAQEALNNVRKHASASVTILSMTFGENKITMSITDNGRGFELPDSISYYARQQRLGLIGIAERVHLIGGTYEVQSSPGKGTVLMIEVSS